jgi:hypothetical protein
MNLISEIKDGNYKGINNFNKNGNEYDIHWSMLNLDGVYWRILDMATSDYGKENTILVQSVENIPGCTLESFENDLARNGQYNLKEYIDNGLIVESKKNNALEEENALLQLN